MNTMEISVKAWKSGLLLLLTAALALGIFFRVTHLDRKVYWHDEVFTSIRATGYNAKEIVAQVFSGEPIAPTALLQYQTLSPEHGWSDTWRSLTTHPEHPPLYYLLIRFWMERFGCHVAAVRSLSVLFSLLSFPALYWLCRELFNNPRIAWIALTLFAVSPFQMLYAQEARQSSLWTLSTLLATAALLRAMRRPTRWSWGLYALTVALNLYTFLLSGMVLISHSLLVLTTKPWSWRLVRSFFSSLAVGLLCFTPWIVVLIHNWLSLQSVTLWTRDQISRSFLMRLWGLHSSGNFIDFGWPIDYIGVYLLPPIILLILAYALWILYRHAPARTSRLILLLIALPVMALIGTDLLLGGQRSSHTRYFVPMLIGEQLAMAHLIAYLLPQPSVWKRQFGRGLMATFLILGIISCGMIWQAETWWSKGPSFNNPRIASMLNQFDQPVVISSLDNTTLGNAISLSYLIKAQDRFQLVIDPALPKMSPEGNYFLFYPTDTLLQNLEKTYSVKAEPLGLGLYKVSH